MPPPGVEPGHVTHPSTNLARRRVTSLIRPTPLPLRHAANQSVSLLPDAPPSTSFLRSISGGVCYSSVEASNVKYQFIQRFIYKAANALHTTGLWLLASDMPSEGHRLDSLSIHFHVATPASCSRTQTCLRPVPDYTAC